jgi:hypothetical protein
LTIGIHEIASVSERRIERLVNPALSGLPAFLVSRGGLNSGFMIAHCTAAALVSENKVTTTQTHNATQREQACWTGQAVVCYFSVIKCAWDDMPYCNCMCVNTHVR